MSNGTTSSKKDGSLKKANWVDSAPKQGVEGHDYFVRGTKYTNSNVSAKYGGVMNAGVASSTVLTGNVEDKNTEFLGMGVESDIASGTITREQAEAVNKGSNSSLDRMANMVNNANNTNSVIKNYNPVQDFKPKSAVQQIIDAPDTVVEQGEDTSQYSGGKTGKLNTQSVMDHLNLKKSLKEKTGQWSEGDGTEYQNKKAKLSALFDAENPNSYQNVDRQLNPNFSGPKPWEYGGSQYQGYGGINNNTFSVADQFSSDLTGTGLLGVGKEGARWAPGTGEVMDFAEMTSDFAKGNYGDATISAIATGIPILPAKYTKKAVKYVNNLLNPFAKKSARIKKLAEATKKYEQSMNQFSPGGKIDEMLKASGKKAPTLRKRIMSGGSNVKKYKRKIDKSAETFSGTEEQDNNIAIKKSGVTSPTG